MGKKVASSSKAASRPLGKDQKKTTALGINRACKVAALKGKGWMPKGGDETADIWFYEAKSGFRSQKVEINIQHTFMTKKDLIVQMEMLMEQADTQVCMVQPLFKPKDMEKMKKLKV